MLVESLPACCKVSVASLGSVSASRAKINHPLFLHCQLCRYTDYLHGYDLTTGPVLWIINFNSVQIQCSCTLACTICSSLSNMFKMALNLKLFFVPVLTYSRRHYNSLARNVFI